MKLTEAIGAILGSVVGFLIGTGLVAGVIYFILTTLIGYTSCSFLQVWGTLMLVTILRNLILSRR